VRGGQEPPGGGRLAGAGAAALKHVLAFAQRQPGAVLTAAGHRHVLHLLRPRADVNDLALGADVLALTHPPAGGGLPHPPAVKLMATQLIARAEVLQAPTPSSERISADDEFQLHTWDTTHNVMHDGPERVLGLLEDVAAELP